MSWWVSLSDDGGQCSVESFTEGGTYKVGGSSEAELNITYNYSKHYYQHLDKDNGLRALDGQRAGDWIERLESAVKELGTERADDYWAATEGNAGHALNILLSWAKQHPNAVFRVN